VDDCECHVGYSPLSLGSESAFICKPTKATKRLQTLYTDLEEAVSELDQLVAVEGAANEDLAAATRAFGAANCSTVQSVLCSQLGQRVADAEAALLAVHDSRKSIELVVSDLLVAIGDDDEISSTAKDSSSSSLGAGAIVGILILVVLVTAVVVLSIRAHQRGEPFCDKMGMGGRRSRDKMRMGGQRSRARTRGNTSHAHPRRGHRRERAFSADPAPRFRMLTMVDRPERARSGTLVHYASQPGRRNRTETVYSIPVEDPANPLRPILNETSLDNPSYNTSSPRDVYEPGMYQRMEGNIPLNTNAGFGEQGDVYEPGTYQPMEGNIPLGTNAGFGEQGDVYEPGTYQPMDAGGATLPPPRAHENPQYRGGSIAGGHGKPQQGCSLPAYAPDDTYEIGSYSAVTSAHATYQDKAPDDTYEIIPDRGSYSAVNSAHATYQDNEPASAAIAPRRTPCSPAGGNTPAPIANRAAKPNEKTFTPPIANRAAKPNVKTFTYDVGYDQDT
jgi:hypothetical protein